MPIYEHGCNECEYVWEDIFKMSDPVPDNCPQCNAAGTVRRLISLCAGRVELTGREHVMKQWQEGKKLAREAKNSESLKANIIGEEAYHKQVSAVEKAKKDFSV